MAERLEKRRLGPGPDPELDPRPLPRKPDFLLLLIRSSRVMSRGAPDILRRLLKSKIGRRIEGLEEEDERRLGERYRTGAKGVSTRLIDKYLIRFLL